MARGWDLGDGAGAGGIWRAPSQGGWLGVLYKRERRVVTLVDESSGGDEKEQRGMGGCGGRWKWTRRVFSVFYIL